MSVHVYAKEKNARVPLMRNDWEGFAVGFTEYVGVYMSARVRVDFALIQRGSWQLYAV